MRSTLVLSVVLLLVGHTFVRADETEQYNEIRQLLASGKLDEAEQSFKAAVEANPDSTRLGTLNNHFYFYFNRAGRTLDAARYAEADVDRALNNLVTTPQLVTNLVRQLENVTTAYTRVDQRDVAIQKLDDVVTKLSALPAEKKSPAISAVIVELRAKKSLLLAGAGKNDEGRALLDSIRKEAEATFTANADDATAALALASVLAIRVQFESGSEAASAASKEHLSFLSEQAKAHPASLPLVSAYYNAQATALSRMTRTDAVQADTELASLREFLASLDKENPEIQSWLRLSERGLASLQGQIAATRAQQELIGQPAFALEVEAWVNGSDLTDRDLEGKVVLIDFWAVWCGPCIATFPHLREWNDKYADKGLAIIGATRYYSYDWDDATSRITKVEGLSAEDERAAMVRFAQHHELKHRFMIMPKASEFSKKYGVTGIPQAVLIGRDGKVQMIRVGSGEANAHDLEAKIAELLAASN